MLIGFIILRTTGLSSQLQCKNPFWKIYTESWALSKMFQNLGHQTRNWFIFFKTNFSLKLWAQAGRFEYHEHNKQNNVLSWVLRGRCELKYIRFPRSKSSWMALKLHRHDPYTIYHRKKDQAYKKVKFLDFQHTLFLRL